VILPLSFLLAAASAADSLRPPDPQVECFGTCIYNLGENAGGYRVTGRSGPPSGPPAVPPRNVPPPRSSPGDLRPPAADAQPSRPIGPNTVSQDIAAAITKDMKSREASPHAAFADPVVPVARGSRETESFNPMYARQKADWPSVPDCAGLASARDNIEVVARNSLAHFAEEADDQRYALLAKRLRSLKLVSVDEKSVREIGEAKGRFAAEAVFKDRKTKRKVQAKLIADFCVVPWELTGLELDIDEPGLASPNL
jgi:hypothetical protein